MNSIVNLKYRYKAIFFFVFALLSFAQADTLRVVNYNTLNFRGAQDNDRIPYYRMIMRAIAPDVAVMQEILTASAIDSLRHAVFQQLNDDWQSAPFNDGPDTDNALIYRSSKVRFISQRQISIGVRNVTDYLIEPANADSAHRIHIFSAHLKAGQEQANADLRASECVTLRNQYNLLPQNSMFMMTGDFNLYTSDEEAYQTLITDGSNANGRLFDPINTPGDWNNNGSFALIHTQSTRTDAFGGGATGGLDDRFDFILVSAALNDNIGSYVLPQSYHTFGNDGQHFNQSINNGVNHAVPDSIANALHAASDHMPVVANFYIEPTANAVSEPTILPKDFTILECYPNPFNSMLTIDIQSKSPAHSLEIFDILGKKVLNQNLVGRSLSTPLSIDFSGQTTGTYLIKLNTQTESVVRKVQLVR